MNYRPGDESYLFSLPFQLLMQFLFTCVQLLYVFFYPYMFRYAGFKIFRGLCQLCSADFDQLLKTITVLLQLLLRPFLVGDVTPYALNEVFSFNVDNPAIYLDVSYLTFFCPVPCLKGATTFSKKLVDVPSDTLCRLDDIEVCYL